MKINFLPPALTLIIILTADACTLENIIGFGETMKPGIKVVKVDSYQFGLESRPEISIHIKSSSASFVPSSDNSLKILLTNAVYAGGKTYGENYLNENSPITFSTNISQNLISIVCRPTDTIFRHEDIYSQSCNYIFYIPSDYPRLDIISDNSRITAENLSVDHLSADQTLSTLLLSNISAGKTSIKTFLSDSKLYLSGIRRINASGILGTFSLTAFSFSENQYSEVDVSISNAVITMSFEEEAMQNIQCTAASQDGLLMPDIGFDRTRHIYRNFLEAGNGNESNRIHLTSLYGMIWLKTNQ